MKLAVNYRIKPGYTVRLPLRVLLRGGDLLENPPPELVKNNIWKLELVRSVDALVPEPQPICQPDVLLDGAWAGRRCFIIGGGPSLVGFDFSQLEGELVIGVNRTFEKFDPSVIFSIDLRLYKWIMGGKLGSDVREKFLQSAAAKLWLDVLNYDFDPSITKIPVMDIAPNYSLSPSLKKGLPLFTNSGMGAMNLAICLGANPIYLLGFDLHTQGKFQRWWHDGYPEVQRDNVYKSFIQEFEFTSLAIQETGAQIINLNPDSALQCFEFGKMPDQKVLPDVPVVAKFATGDGKVTVITPTGDRPEALALLRRWMATQTRQADQWIIIDDGTKPVKAKKFPGAKVIRRNPRKDDPACTLGENLRVALPHIAHEKVLVMEDDDWYGPDYIATMADLLEDHELVGISGTKYYHPGIPGYREMGRGDHASLSQTAFRKSLLPELEKAIPFDNSLPDYPECSVDMRLWARANGNSRLVPGADMQLHCSIKGMPGRGGAGVGHDKRFYTPDKDLTKFQEWCDDVEAYRGFIKA